MYIITAAITSGWCPLKVTFGEYDGMAPCVAVITKVAGQAITLAMSFTRRGRNPGQFAEGRLMARCDQVPDKVLASWLGRPGRGSNSGLHRSAAASVAAATTA
jgi:hypothetical protein